MSSKEIPDNPSLAGRRMTRRRPLAGLVSAIMLGLLLLATPVRAQQDNPAPAQPEQLDLSDQQAVKARGDLYMVRKFFPEAAGMYHRLTELDPKNPLYQNLLGIAYHQLQDFKSAKRCYQAAIKLNPEYAEAVNNLAAVEYAQKNYRASILTYLKALKLSQGDAVIYSNLGTAYFAYKKYDYAMASYRYALMRDPAIFERGGRSGSIIHQQNAEDMGAFNFYMAKTYASLGDVDNTLLYINKAWEAGYADLRKNLNDKAFAFLAKEQRFLDLLAQMDAAAAQESKPN
jgi:tetratricopeptide (TPR) repeat protein